MLIGNRYELHEQIGAGGMGAVFRGLDTQTGKTVAIKRLKDDAVAQDPGIVQRFKREAEALRQLNHPNIVRVLATADEGGRHFIIMEYLSAGSLADALTSGTPLPMTKALSIALDLADALTRTHRLNIIHRDLKPANVLLADDGTPRLTDFGIAHMGNMERVTTNNFAIGTLDYVPPELLNGNPVDARADIWSFGVMLFEMLTGTRPFRAETMVKLAFAILTDPTPDLERLRPDVPIALVDLVYRMLEKDREARVSSVRLVGAALEDILAGKNVVAGQDFASTPLVPGEIFDTVDTKRFDAPVFQMDETANHNLPAQTTPFVGRETELGELARLLEIPDTRLVTILAPGGMGKTRLALETAGHFVANSLETQRAASPQTTRFKNGIYLVSLAPLTSAEHMVAAVADAVGFRFPAGGDPRQLLLDFFREKQTLLIMDNFEHLLDGVGLVSEILQTAPGVKIIATSRQRLNLSSETVFTLSGMDFPDWETPEDALAFSAVKLFMQSARRVRPDFELKADDLLYVARICRAVEGMPLGILLAAAWVEAVSVAEIAEEISKSLDFLATEMSDIPTRQRSIRAVFDYSWNLLPQNERILFSSLSVFRGGFTREAAQAVTGAGLRELTTLVTKSLLRRDPDSGRYEIHDLLRQYGEEQLEKSGGARAVHGAHSTYYAEFMQRREGDLKGRRQQAAEQEIETDFENIRQAWYDTISQDQIERLDQFVYALNLIAYQRKQYAELVALFADAVEALQHQFGSHRNYGRLLTLYGQCLEGLVQLENAQNYLRQAAAIAEAENDAFGIAQASLWLARVMDSDPSKQEEVLQLCERSIRIFRELGDEYELANALHYQGYLLWAEGKHQESVDLNRQILEVRRRLGDAIGMAASLYNIVGSLYYTNPTEAEAHCREVLTLFQRLHQPFGIGVSQIRLAAIELYKENLEAARTHIEDALNIAHENGFAFILSDALVQLAWIEIASDRFREAEASIQQDSNTEDEDILAIHTVIQSFIDLGLKDVAAAKRHLIPYLQQIQADILSGETTALLGMGLILAADGQPERGLEWLSWVKNETTIAPYRVNMPLVTRSLAAIKAQLSDEAYSAAWGRGKALHMQEAVAQWLREQA